MKRVYKAGILFPILFFLIGCYSKDIRYLNIRELKPAEAKVLLNAPLVLQHDNYSCGTTSVSMALSFYEERIFHPIDKDNAWEISRTNRRLVRTLGNDVYGFSRLIRFYGYEGELVNRLGLNRLRTLLSNGVLVVMLIQPNPERINTHAVLAHGYDDDKRVLYVRDPANSHTQISYDELDGCWRAFLARPLGYTVNGGFLIYTPDV